MLIDIYKSARNRTKYLAVPANTDLSGHAFPSTLDPDLHEVISPLTTKDFQRGEKHIGVDTDKALDDLQRDGFAVFGATITVKIRGE
jgi:uncharacterized protein YcgL (UPF0745 family)